MEGKEVGLHGLRPKSAEIHTHNTQTRTCVDAEGLGEVIKTEGEANTIGCLWWLLLVVVGVAARALAVRLILASHHFPTRSRRT